MRNFLRRKRSDDGYDDYDDGYHDDYASASSERRWDFARIVALVGFVGALILIIAQMDLPTSAGNLSENLGQGFSSVGEVPKLVESKQAENQNVVPEVHTSNNAVWVTSDYQSSVDFPVETVADYCVNPQNPRIMCGYDITVEITAEGVGYFVNGEYRGIAFPGMQIEGTQCKVNSYFPTDGFCVEVIPKN